MPELRANIKINKDEWTKIAPESTFYKNRKYLILKDGWTDIISRQIWSDLKLPCCFTFKSVKCNQNDNGLFLNIQGRCTECNNNLNLYSVNGPDKDGLLLHISTYDSKDIVHSKRRQLRGTRRTSVVQELQGESAYAWIREEANKKMEFGDVIPSHIYKPEVLWKAKQLEADKELGNNKLCDPLYNLIKMKEENLEVMRTVKQIGISDIFMIYWSPE